ncbi:rhodanese-like domain-containing protein [Leadbetterella sp. DM7]|uniref:rhodanese-like domain-containing protein n=1 Tax=Leadbetterella sp. DM7 TaxID=3235085 RepID=UPI00349E9013
MFNLLKTLFGSSNTADLQSVIKEGAYLVDVRTPGEFASGSVKGAVNIPLDKLPSQLGKFKNRNNVVVFCRSGGRSAQAKALLNRNGFTNVINGGTWENVQRAADNL